MGLCTSCCKESNYEEFEHQTPDPDARRQQMVEAAEKRRQEQERRGIGNVEAVKRQQKLSQQREERSEGASTTGGLRWQVE